MNPVSGRLSESDMHRSHGPTCVARALRKNCDWKDFRYARPGVHGGVAPSVDLVDLSVCRWKRLGKTGEGTDPAEVKKRARNG